MTRTAGSPRPSARELPIAPDGELELRLGANGLRVRVTEGDRVVVRGQADHDLERDVEITSGEGWVRIADGPAGTLRVGPVSIRGRGHAPDLEIEVPRGVRISGRTLSGDIEAVGLRAPSRWQTASGDVRIGAEAGPLAIETVSGDALVDARGALAITARTVSGDVRVRAPRLTALDAATTSGDIVIESALDEGSHHTLVSVSGDVRLVTASEVTLSLQSITGDLRVPAPHRIEGSRGSRRVVVGSGRVAVDVRTMSGDLELRRSPSDAAPDGRADGAAAAPSGQSWADLGRDWSEWARDWSSWGASWSAGKRWGSPAGAGAAGDPLGREAPVPPGAESPAEPADEDTSPVVLPTVADAEAARLGILRAVESGEIGVEEAADRLAALEGVPAGGEG